jgi:hypothetical protein
MALISPGVQVTVIDQSQYTSTAAGSIAYILVATGQDKLSPSGTVATGTTMVNAEKLVTVTSQRDLVNLFGNPNFELDAAGNPVNGSEINEYGLLAAYSALGVTNVLYVQRANVNLSQLEGTSIRPTGTPADGLYWLDLTNTNWGIYEWSEEFGFTYTVPTVITNTAYLTSGVPLASFGAIGDYAVVATSSSNPIYYKGYDNSWALVGSDSWKSVVATVRGTASNPTITAGSKLIINGNTVNMSGTTVSSAVTNINAALIPGVTAAVNSVGQINIYVNDGTIIYSNAAGNARGTIDTATSTDNTLQITKGSVLTGNIDASANLGILQANIATVSSGGNVFTYSGPVLAFARYTNPPAWRPTDVTPRPDGSIWLKTSGTGNGASWSIKEYSDTTSSFNSLTSTLFLTDAAAVQGLDPVGGGATLAAGTLYVKYDTLGTDTATFKPFIKNVAGAVTVTGNVAGGSATYVSGDSFLMEVTVPGSATLANATVTLSGTTATNLVTSILSANLPNITAGLDTSGKVFISHLAGGTMQFTYLQGYPLSTAGIINDTNIQVIAAGLVYLASPFTALTYTYSTTAPYSNPTDGTLWYYSNPLDVDIMISDGTAWKGYRNVALDARGYDLTNTDPVGPILSATQPVYQADGTTQVVAGDLWVDTGDLDNFPVIYRYNGVTWDLLDNEDNVDANGILFADARWDTDGTTNPITDDLPLIEDLLTSNYIDDDAPDYRLYARGTLLFNTRRSGYNVKTFRPGYFDNATVVPTETDAWVSTSGEDPTTGVPYFGHKAQRNTVVEAMKAAIASSTQLREEQTQFNLICCPGYPELIQDMITLNNDRVNTAFIIGDSPLDLPSDSTQLQAWANNTNLAADNGELGLVSNSEYLGVYYPSGLATNLDGNSVVVPPSHIMLRTIIRSDAVSYPWFAPAGVRRGIVDNVSAIGYVDTANDNTFVSIGVTEGLRDVLYTGRINPLTILPGVGIVAYGQKTRSATTSAMDRINVARLVVYLRTVLARVAAPFIFEPNDTITRSQVESAFNAVFNDLVAKRGIYDYLVVCDETNNTGDRIDRNELYVDIAIQPVKAIEFVYIPVRLQNTGAALTIN